MLRRLSFSESPTVPRARGFKVRRPPPAEVRRLNPVYHGPSTGDGVGSLCPVRITLIMRTVYPGFTHISTDCDRTLKRHAEEPANMELSTDSPACFLELCSVLRRCFHMRPCLVQLDQRIGFVVCGRRQFGPSLPGQTVGGCRSGQPPLSVSLMPQNRPGWA